MLTVCIRLEALEGKLSCFDPGSVLFLCKWTLKSTFGVITLIILALFRIASFMLVCLSNLTGLNPEIGNTTGLSLYTITGNFIAFDHCIGESMSLQSSMASLALVC